MTIETTISRYFTLHSDPVIEATDVMLQKWQESGDQIAFGDYLIQQAEMFTKIRELLEGLHSE